MALIFSEKERFRSVGLDALSSILYIVCGSYPDCVVLSQIDDLSLYGSHVEHESTLDLLRLFPLASSLLIDFLTLDKHRFPATYNPQAYNSTSDYHHHHAIISHPPT